jgi:Flp pilus assembly pilin Flp
MEQIRKNAAEFMKDEDGVSTIEIVLILFVIIGLVLIFKKQITELVNKIFESITSESDEVLSE